MNVIKGLEIEVRGVGESLPNLKADIFLCNAGVTDFAKTRLTSIKGAQKENKRKNHSIWGKPGNKMAGHLCLL